MNDARSPVQGAELWVPKEEHLVLRAGAYGPHTEFARVSARSRFRRGEGLPGAVWATERPLAWRDLTSHFVRAEHAAAAGIDAALGIPWFVGRELAGVITFLFAASTGAAACVEIWSHDDAIGVLRHGGGLYAQADEFERLSKLVQFPYAAGLPGLTWSRGVPVVLDDVRESSEFVRAGLSVRAGLKRAVGLPIYRERRIVHVLAMLGAESRPFVRAFEVFTQTNEGFVSKTCFEEAPTTVDPASDRPTAREMLAREVRDSSLPIISSISGAPATAAESGIRLTLPIHDGVRLRAVACLEF